MPDQETGQESLSGKITIQQAKNPAPDPVTRCHQRSHSTRKNLNVLRFYNSGIEMSSGTS